MFDIEPEPRLLGHPARSSLVSVKEAVEDAGFGTGQVLSSVAACGVFFAEGLELLLISLIAPSIALDLQALPLAGVNEGFILSCIFAGALVGNALGGPLADAAGRQFPITVAFSTVVFFGVVSTFMNSFASISVLRFFVGLGFGLGQPAAIALLNEITPASWRLTTTAVSSVAFGCGALVAVIIAVAVQDVWLDRMTIVEWRLSLRVGSVVVMLLGLVSVFCLPESPAFLAETGDFAHARDTIQNLRQKNKKPYEKVSLRRTAKDEAAAEPLVSYMQAEFMPTLVVCVISLVVNFTLYGSGYAVPWIITELQDQVLKQDSTIAPASVLLISMFMAGLTVFVFALFGSSISQKAGIITCLAVGMAAAIIFNSVQALNGVIDRLLLTFACFGLMAGPAFGYLLLVQLSAVMYPTARSATDVAACISVGRLGAIAAPLVFDSVSKAWGGSWQPFFNIMAILELGCLILLLPMEFKQQYPSVTEMGATTKGTV